MPRQTNTTRIQELEKEVAELKQEIAEVRHLMEKQSELFLNQSKDMNLKVNQHLEACVERLAYNAPEKDE